MRDGTLCDVTAIGRTTRRLRVCQGCRFLDSKPISVVEHYRCMIDLNVIWWQQRGYEKGSVSPVECDRYMEMVVLGQEC